MFDLEKQRTNFGRLALYLVTHPGAVVRLNAFRQRVALARQSLTSALDKLLRVDSSKVDQRSAARCLFTPGFGPL